MKGHGDLGYVGHKPRPRQQRVNNYRRIPTQLIENPVITGLVERMGMAEVRRRLVHTSPALLTIGLPFIARQYHWTLIYVGMVISIAVGVFYSLTHEALLRRSDERDWRSAVWGYIIPIAAAFMLFPQHPELGLVTLQMIAMGDSAAHLGGIMLGGAQLPWNPRKTYAGLFSFILTGTIAATYSYWGEVRLVPISTIFAVCAVTAIAAGLVESFPARSNDNLRVGTTALLVCVAATLWLIWPAWAEPL